MGSLNPDRATEHEDAIVLGLDPGTDKCGLAVVSRLRGTLHQEVVSLAELPEIARRIAARFAIGEVAIGDCTGAERTHDQLARAGIDVPVTAVSEELTSRLARERYWEDNPPRGLARLIPLGLRVPPRPVDDYAALIIAERLLEQRGQRTADLR